MFHIAAKLRAGFLNYISQETTLSDLGVGSQIPFQHISLMSTGSSALVDCGAWGRIEFTHTAKDLTTLGSQLSFDQECRMLRASGALALKDLRAARRNLDLIDEEALREHTF